MLASYRASPFKTFLKLRLPMALPFIFAGAKVAITPSVIDAPVGEFVGSDKELGYVILSSTSYWKTELAFSALILLSLMAIVLFAAVSLVDRLMCPWLRPEALSETASDSLGRLSIRGRFGWMRRRLQTAKPRSSSPSRSGSRRSAYHQVAGIVGGLVPGQRGRCVIVADLSDRTVDGWKTVGI